jgi:hypothetical protein
MDINTQGVEEREISGMFGKYIARSKTIDGGIIEIEFNSDKNVVKITDWKGWSDLRLFRRKSDITNWVKLTTSRGTSITATNDTLIMVYDPTSTCRGFHGETKYAYDVTQFENVKEGNVVRVRHTKDAEGFDIDFDTIDKIEYLETEPKIGYQITTRSGFYNCNDFYLYGQLSLYDHIEAGTINTDKIDADNILLEKLTREATSALGVPSEIIGEK